MCKPNELNMNNTNSFTKLKLSVGCTNIMKSSKYASMRTPCLQILLNLCDTNLQLNKYGLRKKRKTGRNILVKNHGEKLLPKGNAIHSYITSPI